MQQTENSNSGTKSGSTWTAILGAGVLAIGGLSAYQASQTSRLQHDILSYQQQIGEYKQEIGSMRTTVSKADTDLQKSLATVSEELTAARKESSTNLAKAQFASKHHADVLAGKLEKEQKETEQKISAEISKVKENVQETSTDASNRITGINTEVSAVKIEVANSKTEIEKTLADLVRVRGDMGVMSGLVATNANEIVALRQLGDRNIYEFKLTKQAGPLKIGGVVVTLKKADPKRSRYTMDVVADDKRVEKKDKTANEPVQFYVASRARQPFEIVVNQVSKDVVTGYLATPKLELSRK